MYKLIHNPLAGEYYVDLGQCLSIVNRRSYRQAMNYAVANIEVFSAYGARVSVSTIPTTWVTDNATTKAFEFWKDQRAEVLKEQPSLKAKWADFKIFMDVQHATDGIVRNLTPIDGNEDPYLIGEWQASEIVFPVTGGSGGTGAANQQTMHVVGDNIPPGNFQTNPPVGTSFALIEAYANSRRTPQSPDPSTTGVSETTNPYTILTAPDSTFQDIAENVLGRNDEAPYDLDAYPGGELNADTTQIHDVMIVRDWGDSTNFSSDSVGPFVAPFGLIKMIFNGAEENGEYYIFITLVPGKYKGVLAERGV